MPEDNKDSALLGGVGNKPGQNVTILDKTKEPEASPEEILNLASQGLKKKAGDDFDSDKAVGAEYGNDLIEEDLKNKSRSEEKPDLSSRLGSGFEGIPAIVLPTVRKVAVKKLSRFNFRLGMERTPEKSKLVPGTKQGFMVERKGDVFTTGLENLPEIRERLERSLGEDLGPRSSFWSRFTFKLEDKEHGTILNFDDPQFGALNELAYHAMKASSVIADGMQEYTNGKKPNAEWYIENKDAEAEAKQKEMTDDVEATSIFHQLSGQKRADIGKLIGAPVWGLSDKAASVAVWEFIREKDKPENIKKFLQLARMQDSAFNVRVLIESAIKYNVVRRNKALDYSFNNEVLGKDIDAIVSKLAQGTESTLRLAIQRQLEAKVKMG